MTYLNGRDKLQPLEQEQPPPRPLQVLPINFPDLLPELSIIRLPPIKAKRRRMPGITS